ncbi:PAS domain-containing sensor histidine kinase [Salinispora tropica]|uniref:histidine kinase n=1 Tax=Salinispora tropica (strain ATCC BAA-916 / DSM 44818 / JCM 13857 / NBRC 105044 / CNB-440) TaxID=369723 RepID=A4XDD5_SALTO|nr:PAS domain-containing sensor histidine kinase [Salinispora tropica]ABP56942.1 PAS/PAC sensor signal transduction histidine kinase [Salinispora tropica CNB-440]
MPRRTDFSALINGHTAVIEMINSGEAGVPALNQLLRVAQEALGAAGMAFVEFAPTGGRVIVATGTVEWALGHPLPVDDPDAVCLLSGPRVHQLDTGRLTGRLGTKLTGPARSQMVVSRAEIGGQIVGSLHALYPADEDQPCPDHQCVMAYVASCVAHLYGDQCGLPVHVDGPIVATLADGLAVVDREARVRLWNPAAAQITGQAVTDVLGQTVPFPLPPPGQALDHRLPDGRWLRVTSGELPGPGTLRVVTFRDITNRQQNVTDHDLFVAVTSHELRTPVTVIKGYADTLTDHWEALTDADRQLAARKIGQRANELARLVDRLLSSTAEAGPGGMPPAPYDLGDALRAAVTDLPAELRRRITLTAPVGLPRALGHRASLATVVTELCTNAAKYSPPASPITVTAGADGQTVSVRVTDQGIGIRPEHVERAFDQYWQGDSRDHRRLPGAGLGLFLVRRIVEQQNGWVSLRPKIGGGTVAEVRLPHG